MDKEWPDHLDKVYGINSLALNLEFSELIKGNKGFVHVKPKLRAFFNKDVELFSIISDVNPLDMDIPYSINGERVQGTNKFFLYKENGALDNVEDAKFIH